MDNLKMVGMGCYGKPETVSRMFRKMVKIHPIDMHLKPSVEAISGCRLALDDNVLKLSLTLKPNTLVPGKQTSDNFSLIFES